MPFFFFFVSGGHIPTCPAKKVSVEAWGDREPSALFIRTLLSAQLYHIGADGSPAGSYQMVILGAAVRDVRILPEQDFKAVVKIPQQTIQGMFETCGNAENSNRK